ncbi:hypothetical protein [Arthrobacter sp. NPDC058127]
MAVATMVAMPTLTAPMRFPTDQKGVSGVFGASDNEASPLPEDATA